MNKPQIPSTDQTERKAFLQGAIRLDYLASLMGQDEKYEEFLPVLWRESPCREKDLPKDSSGAWYELFYSILPFFIFDPTTSNLITPNKNSKSDSDSVYMLLPVLKQFLKGKGVPIPQGLQEDTFFLVSKIEKKKCPKRASKSPPLEMVVIYSLSGKVKIEKNGLHSMPWNFKGKFLAI